MFISVFFFFAELDWNFHSYLSFFSSLLPIQVEAHCRWYSFHFGDFVNKIMVAHKKEYYIKWAFVFRHVDQHTTIHVIDIYGHSPFYSLSNIWILTANENSILNVPIVTSWQLRWFSILFCIVFWWHQLLVSHNIHQNGKPSEKGIAWFSFYFRKESWQAERFAARRIDFHLISHF